MRKSIPTMGANDRIKANKRATKASRAFASFFHLPSKDPEQEASSLNVEPSSVTTTVSEYSSSAVDDTSITATGNATTTPNATTTNTSAVSLSFHPKRHSIHSIRSHETAKPGEDAPPSSLFSKTAQRAKSIILLENKAAAVFMKTGHDEDSKGLLKESRGRALNAWHMARLQSLVVPPFPEKPAEIKGTRTFRVWTPKHRRNSILFNIGNQRGQAEADHVFDVKEIRNKSFHVWSKEAKALLPSNTGGAPIEELMDALNAAPTLQKEGDPRVVQKTLKRLSVDSDDKPTFPQQRRRSSVRVKIDYTKRRSIQLDGDWNEERKRRRSSAVVVDLGELMENEEDKERLIEYQRKQAGIDLKAKVDTLRQLSDNLSNKRQMRQQLLINATGRTVLDTEEIPLREHVLYVFQMLGDYLHDLMGLCLIWDNHIREINGRFGVVIANYFEWLRQMVGVEIMVFILSNMIIIIPSVVEQYNDPTLKQVDFSFKDLVTGEGYFHHSYLYYSGYHHRNEDSANPLENPAFRFLFCILIKFLIFTYFIFSRLTKYYHTARMESTVSGVANMETFKTIICAWDFSCRSEEARFYLRKTIRRDMMILARMSRERESARALVQIETEHKKVLAFAVKHLGTLWGPWAIHIIGNLLIIVACAILGFVLYEFCQLKLSYYLACVSLRDDNSKHTLDDPHLCPNGDEYLSGWIFPLPAIFASMTTLLLTKFILFVGDLESWTSPERKIYATMIRAGLFYFTNLGVFYTFWLRAKPTLNQEGFVAETIFGKELYRLVVIQGLVDVTLNLGVKGIYHLIRRKSKNYQMTEFRSESCVLSMFFMHSVSRIGILFSPPISFFVTLRLIVDFYQNKFSLVHLSSHESYSVHVSQVYGPFLLSFFVLCYLMSCFMNVYYLSETIPSNYDGPFEIYNTSYDEVLSLLLSSEKKTRWIADLAQPGFLTTLLAILGANLYFCREWAYAYEPVIQQLNFLIVLERGDRDLLLKAIFEIGSVTARNEAKSERISRVKQSRKLDGKSSSLGSADSGASGDDVDRDIDELIHHVQRRKSLGVDRSSTTPVPLIPPIEHHRHSLAHDGHVRRRHALGSMAGADFDHHKHHMEAIVAKIVKKRRKSLGSDPLPPPLEPPQNDNTVADESNGELDVAQPHSALQPLRKLLKKDPITIPATSVNETAPKGAWGSSWKQKKLQEKDEGEG